MRIERAEVEAEIKNIQNRLNRVRVLRGIIGNPLTPEDRILRNAFERPTSLARDESVISPEEAKYLDSRVTEARARMIHLFEMGLARERNRFYFPDDPLYYIYETEDYEAAISLNAPQTRDLIPDRFCTMLAVGKVGVQSDYNFFGGTALEIEFPDSEDTKKYAFTYNSGRQPLENLTIPEFKISMYLVENFLKSTESLA